MKKFSFILIRVVMFFALLCISTESCKKDLQDNSDSLNTPGKIEIAAMIYNKVNNNEMLFSSKFDTNRNDISNDITRESGWDEVHF